MNMEAETQSEHPDYPVEISLGKPVKELMPALKGDKGPTTKQKIVYPCLYLSEIPGLESIPDEGHALIYFRKKRVTEDMESEGKEPEISVDLEIQEMHLPEQSEMEENDSMEKEMRSMLEKRDEDEAEEPAAESEQSETEEPEEEETY